MGDGLKYVFEIDATTPGLDALLSKLESAEKILPKVKHGSEEAGKAHQKHGKDAEHLEGVLTRLVHAGIEPFLHKAKEIAEFEFIRRGVDKLIEAPGEIAEALKEVAMEMIDVAAKTERVNSSFALFFGAEKGSEVLEYLESIAGATEFTDNRLKGAAQSLAKVGFEGEGLTRALAASLDAAALSPDKEAGLGSALQTLEMVKATGRIRSETLLSLGLGPDKFFKELANRTGEGVDTVKKKLAAGKVDTNEALEALYTLLTQKTGKDLGGAGVAMGKGLEAKLTHLKDLPEQFFEKLASSPGVASFTDVIGHVLDGLDPESPAGKKIFAGLDRAFTTIGSALEGVNWDKVFTAIGDIADALPAKIDLVVNAFKGIAPILIEAVKEVAHLTEGVLYLFSLLPGGGHKSIEEVRAQNLKEVDVENNAALDAIMAKHGFGKKGEAVGDGLADGMKVASPKVAAAGVKMADTASGATSKALGIHSPSKVFTEFGEQTAAGFAVGVEGASGMIDDVVAGAFAVPAPQGGRFAAGGAPVVVTFGDIKVNVPGGSMSSADEIGEATRAAVRDEMIEVMERFRTEAGV